MTSGFPGQDSFVNRGIFRNPISTIERTHTKIARTMHSFAGAVAEVREQLEADMKDLHGLEYPRNPIATSALETLYRAAQ